MHKIMIIDDDLVSLSIGKAFLDDEYEVALVYSGQQALGILKDAAIPDLILLDMLMPGISGMDLIKIIKQDDRLKDIPVIFLSGEGSIDVEVEGYLNGACDFLQKPVNSYLLKAKIKHFITFVELRRENKELRRQLGLLRAQ